MNHLQNLLEKRIGFWREFAICVAIAVVSRGSMLFPLNYSQDTYRFLNYQEAANFALFACEMRAFGYPLINFLEAIGAQYPYAGADVSDRIVRLPFYTSMSSEDQGRVIRAVLEWKR